MQAGKPYSLSRAVTLRGEARVRSAIAATHAFAVEAGLAQGAAAKLAMIVEELVGNLVEHGGAGAEEAVDLILRHTDDETRLSLIDPCPPFDPRTAPTGGPNGDRGGGVGLELVREWADILSYMRVSGRNRLELRLKPVVAS